MKRIAWICLATTLATLVIVGLSAALSFRSHAALYYALRIGWPVLRTSAAIQVTGQAILTVALSFWVTAIFMDLYAIKLIVLAGIMAVGAVIALCGAIFAKIDDGLKVDGEIVSETDAPALWERIRGMAAKLKTAAPNQIIAGVVPSFFVTEHPVTAGAKLYQGRTLFLSLPLLKVMTMEEADAVLGHELAHFSGQDTLWSRKISPLTARFALYLQRLGAGFTGIVAHFMHLFWKLYTLAISKLSRAREFRADRIGAELVSKEALRRALVKVTCYCEYRVETDVTILNQETFDQKLDLGFRLEQGYPAFVPLFIRRDKSKGERVPHPFDSHPTLTTRLAQIGFETRAALDDPEIQQPATASWHQEISSAPAMEERLWRKQLALLEFVHRRLRRGS